MKIEFVAIEVQWFKKDDVNQFIAIYMRDRTEYINKLIMKSFLSEKQNRI